MIEPSLPISPGNTTGASEAVWRLPADLAHLATILDDIEDFAAHAGLGEERRLQLRLIAEELIVNVLHHAYGDGQPGWIEVGLHHHDCDTLCLSVRDGGPEFNPLLHVDPDLTVPLTERSEGGLGIYLVKQFADAMEYRREADQNIVSIHFRKMNPSQPLGGTP